MQNNKNEFETLHYIPIDRICCDTPRSGTQTNDESFIYLAESIKKYGLLNPVLLKRISVDMSDETGLFALVSGYRRICATKLLGEKKVKALILPQNIDDISKISFIDNSLRTFYDIFEICDILGGIYSNFGGDFQGTAEALCVSKKYLGNILDLTKFSENERDMCRQYALTDFQILCLSKIDDFEDRKVAIRHIGSRGLSKRQTEEYFYDLLGLESLADVLEPSKKKMVLKDIRLFYNTIDRTVDSFGECGVPIEYSKEEHNDGFKISIFIKKKKSVS